MSITVLGLTFPTLLAKAVGITGSILAARGIGKAITNIGERITPYEKTRAYKQTEQNYRHQQELTETQMTQNRELTEAQIRQNREIAMMQIRAQAEIARQQMLQNLDIAREQMQEQEAIAKFNAIEARRTNMMVAEYNAYQNLHTSLLQDAIRNFPLNISPLVMLENNHISTDFLLGESTFSQQKAAQQVLENIGYTKPVNVFITPMHIDSRLSQRDNLVAQVYDILYEKVEGIFVNEYSRNGQRPVVFYPTAWKNGVRGGLHAAEEIYYFLKGMPTVVVEPRYDGKQMKLMLSCWGIGYMQDEMIRQEINLGLDWYSSVTATAYGRSMAALNYYRTTNSDHPAICEQMRICEQNVNLFEQLKLSEKIQQRMEELQKNGRSSILDEIGDYTRYFALSSADVAPIADIAAASIAVTVAAIADVNHLLANDVDPHLPLIIKQYFPDIYDTDFRVNLDQMYTSAYDRLISEYPSFSAERKAELLNVRKQLGVLADNNEFRRVMIEKLQSYKIEIDDLRQMSDELLFDTLINNLTKSDTDFVTSIYNMLNVDQKNRIERRLIELNSTI